VVVGGKEEQETGLGQERGFFGSSPASSLTLSLFLSFFLSVFLILLILELWIV